MRFGHAETSMGYVSRLILSTTCWIGVHNVDQSEWW